MKVIMPHNAAGRRLCVYITAVRLYCFRSYTELRFEPAKGLNVIVGANAAGKTNILESVFLAALGRSHRTRRDAELINSLSDKAYAGIELVSKFTQSLIPMIGQNGMDWMYANCSTTAQTLQSV